MVEYGLLSPTVATSQAEDLALTGWRDVEEVQPDGTVLAAKGRSHLRNQKPGFFF
ncbi:MAG: hypothetical protein GDA48_29045 [Hormoscilla sp. GM102CHS1]|nr:hypothetical protein [Hormoscilla sp. GM102CHS1]